MSAKTKRSQRERNEAPQGKPVDIRLWQQASAINAAVASLPAGALRRGCRIVFSPEPPAATVAIAETPDHRVGLGRTNMDGAVHSAPQTPALMQDVRLLLQRFFEPYGDPEIALPMHGDLIDAAPPVGAR